jgi:RNA recognition motif-containing protein
LFVFHLPNEWSDFDLFYFFEQFKLGTIVSVRIMTDKNSGRSKGYGFVSYDNAPSAEKAIIKINGKQALGKRLKVELKKGAMLNSIPYTKEPEPATETQKTSRVSGNNVEDSLNSMTNMIYEGTTGTNTELQPGNAFM